MEGTCLSYPNKALEKRGDCWSVLVPSNRIVKSCTKLSRPVFSFANNLFGAEGLSISASSSRHLRCGETEACTLLLSHHVDCLPLYSLNMLPHILMREQCSTTKKVTKKLFAASNIVVS